MVGLSTRQVARLRFTSQCAVLKWIWSGKLRATKVDGRWSVTPEDLDAFVEAQEPLESLNRRRTQHWRGELMPTERRSVDALKRWVQARRAKKSAAS